MSNRYYFQDNSQVIYDVVMVEATTEREAIALWQNGAGRAVCKGLTEPLGESNQFIGKDALCVAQYDIPEEG